MIVFLLLGSNLGDRLKHLELTRLSIVQEAGEIRKTSSIYKTAPWGQRDQPDFYNQVLEVKSDLAPAQLLSKILEIEKRMGRTRNEKWEARIIDIDILFYNDLILDTMALILPHPAIQNRKFTLVPLAEIAPSFLHPVLKKDMITLLRECRDPLPVEKIIGG